MESPHVDLHVGHFFLWHLNIRLGKKHRSITLSQLRTLLQAVLPLKLFGIEDSLAMVKWIQVKNHRAMFSRKEELRIRT